MSSRPSFADTSSKSLQIAWGRTKCGDTWATHRPSTGAQHELELHLTTRFLPFHCPPSPVKSTVSLMKERSTCYWALTGTPTKIATAGASPPDIPTSAWRTNSRPPHVLSLNSRLNCAMPSIRFFSRKAPPALSGSTRSCLRYPTQLRAGARTHPRGILI